MKSESVDTKKFPTISEMVRAEFDVRMVAFDGNKRKVADSFGVTVKTVYNWIADWGAQDKYLRPKADQIQVLST